MTTDYRMLDRVPGQRLMTVRACDIERIEKYDSDPDLSYLDLDADPGYAAQMLVVLVEFMRLFTGYPEIVKQMIIEPG